MKPPDDVLDHGSIVRGVSIHEGPGAGDWDGGEGTDVVENNNSITVQLGIVDYPPGNQTFRRIKTFLLQENKTTWTRLM